ncbi:hypothetical protein MRS44_001545 [Fusarium solani]|uniref:uncharacterized protein n=1 Tax=Fusarium solani TaxID=169388 RepID=UPI0032C3D705|nr:hypothetical protein MRS44_001545 [Fusarium solani]
MRPLSACVACRDRRKKCDRAPQAIRCNLCIKRGLECSFESTPEIPDKPLEHASPAILNDPDLSEELVDLYFRHGNIAFPCLFHWPSFKASVKNGSVPRILFLGAVGLAARFSSHPMFAGINPWERGRPYAKEAEKLLDLHDTSITTIQACVLLACICVAEGEAVTESVYYAIACRMAMVMDLPNAPVKTAIEREVNNRVWWSLVTSDTWLSAAFCLPRAIKPRQDVPLPIGELTFARLQLHDLADDERVLAALSSESAEDSFPVLAHMIKLNQILYEINSYCATVVAEEIQQESMWNTIHKLSASLDRWYSDLPMQLRYSQDNLQHWTSQGLGPKFICLHINYNNASQRLFYQFLQLSLVSDETGSTVIPTQLYAERCKRHAGDLCDLISHAKSRPETDIYYSLAGHMLVIASTVQLHTLLFGMDESEIQLAKRRLERNFEMLTDIYTYWPIVYTSFSRLKAFHNACLNSKDSSFRLDRWMLQFILEFSKPVDEKDMSARDPERDLWPLDQLRYLFES